MTSVLSRLPPMLAPTRGAPAPLAVGAAALVETPSGPCPAGALATGALVRAADGAWRMVCGVSRARHAAGDALLLSPGALGPGVPRRALRVARDQALLLGEGVWPAGFLEDGAAVRRVAQAGVLVVLATDAPGAIVVEGVACLAPAPPGRPVPDAALVRIRQGGAARSGRVFGPVEGEASMAMPGMVEGWVREAGAAPVLVEVVLDGATVVFGFADLARPDLDGAGLGACGFRFDLALPAAGRHLLELRRAEDGAVVPGGRFLLTGEAGSADLVAPPAVVAEALAALSRARLRRGPGVPR